MKVSANCQLFGSVLFTHAADWTTIHDVKLCMQIHCVSKKRAPFLFWVNY